MKKIKDKNVRQIIISSIFAFVAIIVMIVCAVLSQNVDISEYMARKLSTGFTNVFGRVVSLVPFSVFEILALFSAILAVFLIVKTFYHLAKKQKIKSLNTFVALVSIVLCVVSVYYVNTSFSYNRQSPPVPMIDQNELDKSDYQNVIDNFFDDFLSLASSIPRDEKGFPDYDYSAEELSQLIANEYQKLEDDYYSDYIPTAKGMIFSPIMSELSLAGITFAPLGEANVNSDMPISSQITTIAHELAHTMGIMREEDANLVSAYVLFYSDNELLRYAVCYEYYYRVLWIELYLNGEESYQNRLREINSSPVAKELKAEKEFWDQHRTLSKISDFFNNLYLKFNGQNLGTGSYDDGNFSDATDSGEVDDDGNIIYDITLSDLQKMICKRYLK